MRLSILSLVPIVPLVLADGAALLNSLSCVRDATTQLNSTIGPWDGSANTLIPIVNDSADLLTAIFNATKLAVFSPALSESETNDFAHATDGFADDINSTLTTIISKKKMFQQAFLQPVMLLILVAEKDATNKLSAAVVAKVPINMHDTAMNPIKPVDESFDLAINAFNSI